MKKYTVAILIILIISVMFFLFACGNAAKQPEKNATDDTLPNDAEGMPMMSDDDGEVPMELVYTEVATLEKEEYEKIFGELLSVDKVIAREFYIPFVSLIKTTEELKCVTSETVEKYDEAYFENHALLEVTYFSYGAPNLSVKVNELKQVNFGDDYNVELKLAYSEVETSAVMVMHLRTFLIEIDTYNYSNVTAYNVIVNTVWE